MDREIGKQGKRTTENRKEGNKKREKNGKEQRKEMSEKNEED